MTVINVMDVIQSFLKENVCPDIQFLVPAKKDGIEYEEKYANPEVFAFFEPEKGRLPEDVTYTTPGIVVQAGTGTDNLNTSQRSIDIVLAFSVWNPGKYRTIQNMQLDKIDVSDKNGVSMKFEGDISKSFVRNEEGWRDVYSLMELTKSKIISHGRIGNYLLGPEIKYGSYTKDGALIDFYPYYHLWMSFTLTSIPTPVQREELEELL